MANALLCFLIALSTVAAHSEAPNQDEWSEAFDPSPGTCRSMEVEKLSPWIGRRLLNSLGRALLFFGQTPAPAPITPCLPSPTTQCTPWMGENLMGKVNCSEFAASEESLTTLPSIDVNQILTASDQSDPFQILKQFSAADLRPIYKCSSSWTNSVPSARLV